MECRKGCGACCIAISISSPIPGMPSGKPAGVRCVNLTPRGMCGIFGREDRPKVCSSFEPEPAFCGNSTREAFVRISSLERKTKS